MDTLDHPSATGQPSAVAVAQAPSQRHTVSRWLRLVLGGFDHVASAPSAARPARVELLVLLGLGALVLASALLHLQAVLSSTGASYDIDSFAIQAATVFHHQNVYAVTDRYPYPPVWVWIAAGLQWVATAGHVPFDQVIKIPAVVGDLGTTVLLYVYVHQRFGARLLALVPAALFALNPVAILISAGHGQFDAFVLLFMVLALVLRGASGEEHSVLSGLALGIAIALKGYPVLALPYLVLSARGEQRLRIAIASLAPLLVSAVIYSLMFGYSPNMLTHVLGYRSAPDGAWSFLIGTWTGRPESTLEPIANVQRLLLLAFAVAVPFLVDRTRRATAVALVFAIFQATTVTDGVQYMIWLLPFVCVAWPLGAVLYTLPALAVPLGLYALFFQGAIPATPFWQAVSAALAPQRVWGVAGVVAVSAIVSIRCLPGPRSLRAARSARGRAPEWPELARPHGGT